MKPILILPVALLLIVTSCNRKTQTVPTMMEMFQHICGTMVDSNRHFVDIKDECLWLADSLLYYVENDTERSKRIGARVVAQEIVSSMLSDEPTRLLTIPNWSRSTALQQTKIRKNLSKKRILKTDVSLSMKKTTS